MLFYEWKDIALYPLNSSYVKNIQDRLNISHGFKLNANGQYPPEYFEQHPESQCAIIELKTLLFDSDEFEALEIGEYGWVQIWTKNKIWFLITEGNDNRIERLKFLNRNPQ